MAATDALKEVPVPPSPTGRGPRPPGRRSTARNRPETAPQQDRNGHRILTEDDLDQYFAAVDPKALSRDRRRRHAIHAVVLVLLLLLIGGAIVVATQVLRGQWQIPGWEAAPPPEPLECPAGVHPFTRDSTVNVYNSTSLTGLAGDAANELEDRDFAIGTVGNRRMNTANFVAAISSGPQGWGTAFTVQRHIDGAVFLPDDREGPDVDVVVGRRFTGLLGDGEVDTEPGRLTCLEDTPDGGAVPSL